MTERVKTVLIVCLMISTTKAQAISGIAGGVADAVVTNAVDLALGGGLPGSVVGGVAGDVTGGVVKGATGGLLEGVTDDVTGVVKGATGGLLDDVTDDVTGLVDGVGKAVDGLLEGLLVGTETEEVTKTVSTVTGTAVKIVSGSSNGKASILDNVPVVSEMGGTSVLEPVLGTAGGTVGTVTGGDGKKGGMTVRTLLKLLLLKRMGVL